MARAESDNAMPLSAGLKVGKLFCVMGPSSPGRLVCFGFSWVFWVGSVDGGCVMFAVVVRFTSVLLLVVAISSVMAIPDVGAWVVVGMVSLLTGVTKKKRDKPHYLFPE